MALTAEERAYQREWKRRRRAADPEFRARDAAASREYQARNPEKVANRRREYRKANRDKIAVRNREYYAENGDRLREWQREYDRRNPEARRARDYVGTLRRRHGILPDTWAQMWAAQDGRCYLCGGQLGGRVVIDHDHSHCPPGQSCSACRRGLAHHVCNAAIGLMKDDPEALHRVADALEMAKQGVTQRIALTGEQLCFDEGIV